METSPSSPSGFSTTVATFLKLCRNGTIRRTASRPPALRKSASSGPRSLLIAPGDADLRLLVAAGHEVWGRLIIGCSFHFGQSVSRQVRNLEEHLRRPFLAGIRRARVQTTVEAVRAVLRSIDMNSALEEDGSGWVEYWCNEDRIRRTFPGVMDPRVNLRFLSNNGAESFFSHLSENGLSTVFRP